VGQRGTLGEAATMGLTVAVTHTAGVLALGLLLTSVQALAPERVYPVLGVASGLLLAVMGATLLRRAVARRRPINADADGHVHTGDADADADAHAHAHGRSHSHAHSHAHPASVSRAGLVAMGLAGGLAPSPSALLVLLAALALGRL